MSGERIVATRFLVRLLKRVRAPGIRAEDEYPRKVPQRGRTHAALQGRLAARSVESSGKSGTSAARTRLQLLEEP